MLTGARSASAERRSKRTAKRRQQRAAAARNSAGAEAWDSCGEARALAKKDPDVGARILAVATPCRQVATPGTGSQKQRWADVDVDPDEQVQLELPALALPSRTEPPASLPLVLAVPAPPAPPPPPPAAQPSSLAPWELNEQGGTSDYRARLRVGGQEAFQRTLAGMLPKNGQRDTWQPARAMLPSAVSPGHFGAEAMGSTSATQSHEPRSFCSYGPMSDATPEQYCYSESFAGHAPVLRSPGQIPQFMPSPTHRGSATEFWAQGFSTSRSQPPVPAPMHFAPGAGDLAPRGVDTGPQAPALPLDPAPLAFGTSAGDEGLPAHSEGASEAAHVPHEVAAMTALPQVEGLSRAEVELMLRTAAADAAWED